MWTERALSCWRVDKRVILSVILCGIKSGRGVAEEDTKESFAEMIAELRRDVLAWSNYTR
jgi:hypothetical protein